MLTRPSLTCLRCPIAHAQLFLNQAQLKPDMADALKKAVPSIDDSDIEAMMRYPYR